MVQADLNLGSPLLSALLPRHFNGVFLLLGWEDLEEMWHLEDISSGLAALHHTGLLAWLPSIIRDSWFPAQASCICLCKERVKRPRLHSAPYLYPTPFLFHFPPCCNVRLHHLRLYQPGPSVLPHHPANGGGLESALLCLGPTEPGSSPAPLPAVPAKGLPNVDAFKQMAQQLP